MSQKKLQSRTNLFCFRCQVKLGKILNRGTFCPICRRKICKKCLASSRQNNSVCSKIYLQPLNNEKNEISPKNNENLFLKPDLNESNQLNENLNFSKNQSTISPKLSEENEFNQLSSLSVKKLKNLDTFEKNLNKTFKKDEESIPEKKQRKNSGLYIKRTTSSTADSVVARKYRSTLRNSQNSSSDQQDENQRIDFTTKQLSISCTDLQTSSSKEFECTNNYQADVNFRSLSVQNLDNLKQASSPKFNLHSLLSKLKRSHTIHNVDDIGKRSLFCQKKNIEGSNTLKNQYGQKCGTLWKRSSATLAASGHQFFLKTFGLGKKNNIFKRHSSNTVTTIPLCKLKGICSFCCKKIANEKITNDNLKNNLQDEQIPIPPLRKSNLVNSYKNLKKDTPIKPERQFIVNKCVLEQSCSLVDLNIKNIDNQISENDSGLHNTNSLESLDKKCQDLNKKATTLPKTILNNQNLFENEKRATLKVRSHIEMNEDGTFYVQDSDWEMTSESDHWQKSDQFSSISSNDLNDYDLNIFNNSLFKSSTKQLIVEEKSNTLCNKKNDETANKYKNETDDLKLSCGTLKIENIDNLLDSKTDETKLNKKANDCFENKLKHKSSSVGEKINELELKTEKKWKKKIKRSHSENALYFNVDSADDELEEDEDDFKTSTLTKSKIIFKNKLSNETYSLNNYLIKKEFLHLKIPDQCLDCFSSDEQLMSILSSSDKDNSLNYKVNHLLINKSPMLNDDVDTDSKLKDDLNEIETASDKFFTSKTSENEKLNNFSTKEFENIELNEELKEKIDSINENYYNLYQDDSLDLELENDLEKQEQQYHLIQQRNNITSLENLFSLETIAEEEDEEDYSLKDPKLNLIQKVENSSTENLTSLTNYNNNTEKENTLEKTEVINSKLSNEDVINEDEKKFSINSTNDEELTTNDFRQFKTFIKDSNDENTILSYSLTDDLNIENDATESLNEENFNSFNELGLDENVLIDDQQVIVTKFHLLKKDKQIEFEKKESRSNVHDDKVNIIKNNKPEITKRVSLFNKNFSNFDSLNKKTNENIINKSKPKTLNENKYDKNESLDLFYDIKLKKDFKESGVQIDFNYEDENFNKKEILIEDYSKSDSEQKKFSDVFLDKKVNKTSKNCKNSNTQYNSHQSLDTTNSSGVDSGPSSELELEIRNQKQLNNSNSFKNKEKSTIDCHLNEDLLKLFHLNKVSKNNIKRVQSMVEKNNKKIDFKNNKITRCCSFNIDKTKKNFWLEQDSCSSKNKNNLNKSKSMLNVDEQLNKNEKFLTQEEFNKRRRSYEISLDHLDQSEYMTQKRKKFNEKKFKQLSNEDVEKIKKELIRRSEERLAKYNFDNSLSQSISNKNYSYCQSSDENIDLYKEKRISRKELNLKWKENLKRSDSLNSIVSIKSCYSLNSLTSNKKPKENEQSFNKENQDEYNLTSTDHYVIKETISDQLLTDNFVIIRRSSLNDYNGLKVEENNENYEIKNYDCKEENNDYEEIFENTYVDLSEALPKKKFTNFEHFYENFDQDSINHSENPYISIKDFVDSSNNSFNQNYQLVDESSKNDEIILIKKINRRQSYLIDDNFSYSKVKLPLKRSKSVPGNCETVQRKIKSNILSSVEKNFLNDQLEFQKKHLRHLHKQHWNYRCKNAINNNEEISNFFVNYEENFDKPPELLISYRYNKENSSIELFVKECRNFGNLSDKYLKLYLLPDLKKNKQKTSLQSKTIGHVNNLIEKKSFEICSPIINKKIVFSCDFDEINDLRTIWLSVWRNKKSLLEKSQCIGELFLKVTSFNDKNLELIKQESSFDGSKNNNLFNNGFLEKPFFSKESHLNEENNFEELKTSFGWFSLEQSLFYSGELILAFRYDTEKSELQVLINGAINLLCRKRLVKSMNSFCKIELKRCLIKNDEKQVRFEDDEKIYDNFNLNDIQKTTIIKNNLCPKWNKLFIFNDIPPNQLANLDFEISIWNCQTLTTPYCISYLQLGSNIMHNFDIIKQKLSLAKIDLTAYEKIIQKEVCIWQQICDKKNFNNWIKAWLQLKPID